MKLTDIPAKFYVPFADSAVAPYIRTVPLAPSGSPGQASLQTGFPPANFSPVAAGGVPPFGADFNGLLNQSTAWDQWQSAGRAFPPYDSTFQTAIGGYPAGAIVESLVEPLLFYASLVDDNITNPDNGGAGWLIWSRKLVANKTIYVNGATGNDSNNGLSPATALATLQAAVNLAFSWPPSQFTITISVSPTTYTAGCKTPLYPGPSLIIDGGSPTTTRVSAGNDYAFLAQGPNAVSVRNIAADNTVGAAGPALFASLNGATMTTFNTKSFNAGGPVFNSGSAGSLVSGTHVFQGNAYACWWASNGGTITLQQSSTYTFNGACTITIATAFASSVGVLSVSSTNPVVFVNSANCIATKYFAGSNSVINADSQGVNFFPGNTAGSTATGGEYI